MGSICGQMTLQHLSYFLQDVKHNLVPLLKLEILTSSLKQFRPTWNIRKFLQQLLFFMSFILNRGFLTLSPYAPPVDVKYVYEPATFWHTIWFWIVFCSDACISQCSANDLTNIAHSERGLLKYLTLGVSSLNFLMQVCKTLGGHHTGKQIFQNQMNQKCRTKWSRTNFVTFEITRWVQQLQALAL